MCLTIRFFLCRTYDNFTRSHDLKDIVCIISTTVHTSIIYRARILQPTKYVQSIILLGLYYYITVCILHHNARSSMREMTSPSEGVLEEERK